MSLIRLFTTILITLSSHFCVVLVHSFLQTLKKSVRNVFRRRAMYCLLFQAEGNPPTEKCTFSEKSPFFLVFFPCLGKIRVSFLLQDQIYSLNQYINLKEKGAEV